MNKETLRRLGWFLFFCTAACPDQTAAIDSVRLVVTPVRCFGGHDGEIRIDSVYNANGSGPYYFSLGNGTQSQRPFFDYLSPGVYTVFVFDSTAQVTWQKDVEVPEPEPLIVKILAHPATVHAGEAVALNVEMAPETTEWVTARWQPAELFPDQDTLSCTIHPAESTMVSIVVRNADGCVAEDEIAIEVRQIDVYFPNAIHPGSAENGVFTAFAGQGFTHVAVLRIYNRDGGLVHEQTDFPSNDPLHGWHGRWRDRPAPPGPYLYYAVIEHANGEEEIFEGTVTVVR
jgi:hypothetical protein